MPMDTAQQERYRKRKLNMSPMKHQVEDFPHTPSKKRRTNNSGEGSKEKGAEARVDTPVKSKSAGDEGRRPEKEKSARDDQQRQDNSVIGSGKSQVTTQWIDKLNDQLKPVHIRHQQCRPHRPVQGLPGPVPEDRARLCKLQGHAPPVPFAVAR